MVYDKETNTYNTQIGGYNPKTIVFYYVDAFNGVKTIRTPMKNYDVLIWDNPPIADLYPVVPKNKTMSYVIWSIFGIFIFVLVMIYGYYVISKKKELAGETE